MTSAIFRPASQCGPACLSPSAPHAHQLRRLVRATRALAILLVTAAGGLAIGILPRSARPRYARAFLTRAARALLRAFGITMTRTGVSLPQRQALLVANHISWLDIIAMLAIGQVRIVAKKDVVSWPLIGRLATLSGSIFIDRERPLTLPATVAEIRDALSAGDVVVVFAEGTTSCGSHGMPYRPAVFQAAIDAGACVVPLTLRYRTADGEPTPEPSFIGDETLIASLTRVLSMPSARLDVHVRVGLHPQPGTSRRALMRIVRELEASVAFVAAFGGS